MTSKRIAVELPGDNSLTVYELIEILELCEQDAKVRTKSMPNKDPVIIIWWDEDL
jgi:hypothetical protein